MRPFIRNRHDRVRLQNLLLTEPPLVARDPQRGRARRDTRLVVGVEALFFRVCDLDVVAADLASQGCVVAIQVGVEPFPDGGPAGPTMVRERRVKGVGVFLFGLLGAFFGFEGSGEEGVEGGKSFVEGHVCEDSEEGEERHYYHGADGAADGEESDHADVGEVQTCEQVLEGSGVDETLGVGFEIVDEEEVVAVGLVDKVKADEGETEDQRGDA